MASHRWRASSPSRRTGRFAHVAREVVVLLSPGGRLAPLLAVTDPLPADFPKIRVEVSDPQRVEPGFTVLDRFQRTGGETRPTCTMILDRDGNAVWYSTLGGQVTRRAENGNPSYRSGHDAVEIELLGNVVARTPLDVSGLSLHHELAETSGRSSPSKATPEARVIEVDHALPARTVFDVTVRDPEGEISVCRRERIAGLSPPAWSGGCSATVEARRLSRRRPVTAPSFAAGASRSRRPWRPRRSI